MIIFNHGSFSFENTDGNSLLLILIGGEGLRFFGRNKRSFGDDFGHNSSDGFNSEGKGSSINDN